MTDCLEASKMMEDPDAASDLKDGGKIPDQVDDDDDDDHPHPDVDDKGGADAERGKLEEQVGAEEALELKEEARDMPVQPFPDAKAVPQQSEGETKQPETLPTAVRGQPSIKKEEVEAAPLQRADESLDGAHAAKAAKAGKVRFAASLEAGAAEPAARRPRTSPVPRSDTSFHLGLAMPRLEETSDLWGAGVFAPEKPDRAAEGPSDSLAGDKRGSLPAPKRDGQATGGNKPEKPAGKKKGKATTGVKHVIFKYCYICERETEDWSGNKAECRPCMLDKEAAERDSKAQGEKTFLDELKKDKSLFAKFIRDWRQECGPSKGPGHKRGGFKFAIYKTTCFSKVAEKDGVTLTMKTEQEFEDWFLKKGMPRGWGRAEFRRRLGQPDRWRSGTDPDCNLPCVQLHGCVSTEKYAEKGREESVEFQTAGRKNVTSADAAMLIGEMGKERAVNSEVALSSTTVSLFSTKKTRSFMNLFG